jgi:hypothetical protein
MILHLTIHSLAVDLLLAFVRMCLLSGSLVDFLLSFVRIGGGSTRIAAAQSEDNLLGDASARNAGAAAVKKLSVEPARIHLVSTANATPAHTVVVIVAALAWATTALIVKENAAQSLLLFIGKAHSTTHF